MRTLKLKNKPGLLDIRWNFQPYTNPPTYSRWVLSVTWASRSVKKFQTKLFQSQASWQSAVLGLSSVYQHVDDSLPSQYSGRLTVSIHH